MTRRGALTLLAACCAFAGLVFFPGCSRAPDPWADMGGSVRVVVTIAPLYSLVKAVGGDRVAVKCLCTVTGPHHFQADARDAYLFKKADIFFTVGLQLDDNFSDQLHAMSRGDLRYIKLGGRLRPDQLLAMAHEHVTADGKKHMHGGRDPHVWLGLQEMIDLAEVVRAELTAADPEGADVYKKGAEEYQARLNTLLTEGRKLFAKKKNKRIVSSHEALGYFAKMLNLEVVGTVQPWPGEAPTGKELNALIKLCSDKDKPVGAITVEPQYKGNDSAGTVQRSIKEVKVPLVEIDTLETADQAELIREGPGWYLARMKRNLEALAGALP